MSRYRKVDPRFWKDEKVCALNRDEKLIALYLFTSAQSNRIGLFSFSPAGAAEDLGIALETFGKGFMEPFLKVIETLHLGWDSTARVLYLPTWWKYNCPENPNVLKACLADLHEVPQNRLLTEFSCNLNYLPETFHQTFREGYGKPSPKPFPQRMADQEQEQEQEQDNKNGAKAPPYSSSKKPKQGIPAELQSKVNQIIARINELSGINFQANSEGTTAEIVRNLRAGKSSADMMLIAEYKWQEWRGTEVVKNFNPTTLYRKKHFDTYLSQAQAKALKSTESRRELLEPMT